MTDIHRVLHWFAQFVETIDRLLTAVGVWFWFAFVLRHKNGLSRICWRIRSINWLRINWWLFSFLFSANQIYYKNCSSNANTGSTNTSMLSQTIAQTSQTNNNYSLFIFLGVIEKLFSISFLKIISCRQSENEILWCLHIKSYSSKE